MFFSDCSFDQTFYHEMNVQVSLAKKSHKLGISCLTCHIFKDPFNTTEKRKILRWLFRLNFVGSFFQICLLLTCIGVEVFQLFVISFIAEGWLRNIEQWVNFLRLFLPIKCFFGVLLFIYNFVSLVGNVRAVKTMEKNVKRVENVLHLQFSVNLILFSFKGTVLQII